jgi:hypothetical protein
VASDVSSTQSLTTAQNILKKPPFTPTNVSLFSPGLYTGASTTLPAAARTITDSQLKSQLNSTLTKQLNGNSCAAAQTTALFDNAALKATVPNSNLRAALLSLKGTAADSAISTIQSGAFRSVKFGTTPDPTAIAMVIPNTGGQKPDIIVNSKYQYEDFRLLGPILGHETLHQDTAVDKKEELIAHSIDSIVYGQALLTTPTLASSNTELTRRENTKLMARINSRDTNGNVRLTTSTGNVYPGSTVNLANFAANFPSGGTDTPGSSNLVAQLKAVTGTTVPSTAGFNDATIALLDNNERALNASQVVQLAKTLQLNVPSS